MSEQAPSDAELERLGPHRAAALWLERLQRDVGERDGARFQKWYDASPAHSAAWSRATAMWDALDDANTPDLVAMRREALTYRPRSRMPAWAPYALAASIVVAVGLAGLAAWRPLSQQDTRPGSSTAPLADAGGHYATAVGQRSTVALADGSKVMLDSDSAVDVTYGAGQRVARLVRGQAYFEVAHDGVHPFRVGAGDRVVTVLGTRFNIRLSSAETRIVLAEGSIGVRRGADPAHPQGPETARLAPGQALVVRPGRADLVVRVDAERQLSWREGFVQFDDEPLSVAVEQMNRSSETKLILGDPALGDLRVSGGFKAGDIEGFAETLSAIYPVRVLADGRGDRTIVRR